MKVTLNPPGQYAAGMRVLDARCGNGLYLRGLRDRRVTAVGCGLSMGMLRAAAHPALLRDLVERAVRGKTPGWRMRPATDAAVRRQVQAVIDDEGAFITSGDLAAFMCR